MKMDITILLLVFAMFWKVSFSIQCYKCDPERSYLNIGSPMCEYYDARDKYIVDCPFSTMCYKKEVLLISLGATTKTIERGCAIQSRDDEQEKVNGKWQYVKNIHEIYPETCKEDPNDGKPTKTTHCYCRGALCNRASRHYTGLVGIILVAIFTLKEKIILA